MLRIVNTLTPLLYSCNLNHVFWVYRCCLCYMAWCCRDGIQFDRSSRKWSHHRRNTDPSKWARLLTVLKASLQVCDHLWSFCDFLWEDNLYTTCNAAKHLPNTPQIICNFHHPGASLANALPSMSRLPCELKQCVLNLTYRPLICCTSTSARVLSPTCVMLSWMSPHWPLLSCPHKNRRHSLLPEH